MTGLKIQMEDKNPTSVPISTSSVSDAVKEKDGFTFIWKIENVIQDIRSRKSNAESPKFVIQAIDNTEWFILLQIGSPVSYYNDPDVFDIYLGRSDDGTVKVTVGFTMSVFGADGSLKLLKTNVDTVPPKNGLSCGGKFLKNDFATEESTHLWKDIYTIRCRIWSCTSVIPSTQCFARTIVEAHRSSFTITINPFSAYQLEQRISIPIPSVENGAIKLDMMLYVTKDEPPNDFMHFEINWTDSKNTEWMQFIGRISLLDCHGKVNVTKKEIYWPSFQNVWKFTPFITVSKLVTDKDLYLPNDCLSIQFDFTAYGDVIYSQIEKTVFSTRVLGQQDRLKQDLKSMYLEGKFSDVSLLADGKTFHVHKNILSARSKVFDTMFQAEMSEKKTGAVHITDVDADTLDRLLMFVYTQTMEDLQIQSAEKLYAAADKYDIPSLKEKCAEMVKSKVSSENISGALALAELYDDTELETAIKELIHIQIE